LVKIQFLNEPDEGKQLLRRALELTDPVTELERLLIGAVNRNFVDGDMEGALADYEMILDLYPDAFPAMNNKGQLLYRLTRNREALEAFEAAHQIEPTSSIPLWATARLLLFVEHDAVGVEGVMHKIIELHPDVAGPLHMLAWSYVGQRRFEDAEAGMRRVLELDSRHPLALPNLAHLLLRQGRAAEAAPIYRQVLAGEVREPAASNVNVNTLNLALALRAGGEDDRADQLLGDLIAALERDDANDDDGLNLAALRAALGRREQVAAWVTAIDPATLPAARLTRLAEVFVLMGRNDEALSLLEQAVAGGYTDIFFLSIIPALGGLQDEPRFLALTETRSPDS